jgi:hypothetical protein
LAAFGTGGDAGSAAFARARDAGDMAIKVAAMKDS